jgi:valyl-tRNA synthetase
MDSKYNHLEQEQKIYKMWESLDAFSPEGVAELRSQYKVRSCNKPYSVLMPPPNANAPLHCGHATYSIQDLMIRFKRMQGFNSCYFPGTDHAGFETQVVYERKLKKEGKSRFDFDRKTLYDKVLNFVLENSDVATGQLKRIGMSADWSRNTFMLEDKVINTVYNTFIKMHRDQMVYKDGYMVNYSTFHGTTFSDLETEYKDSISPLYYINYRIQETDKFITVATVRPETIYADVAIAFNPNDKRYKDFVGKKAVNPLTGTLLPIIRDDYVDIKFGTGALKITPGHDFNDFEIGKKHNLQIISLINLDGKMNEFAKECQGLYPNQARLKSVKILQDLGAIKKIDAKYKNRVLVDYKDQRPIEPMVLSNWFIDTEKLSNLVIKAVKNGDVKFNKKLWKKEILRWLDQKRPWPISRQTVFGISIPAWYSVEDNPDMQVTFISKSTKKSVTGNIRELLINYSIEDITEGLQKVVTKSTAKYKVSVASPGSLYLPETDTFDTWFSSGQWPLTTTSYPEGKDFKQYFPTDFLDSMWDIMFFWIARMLMFSLYLTGKVPYKNVYFHGAIADKQGKKMSKSRGNVIDPLDFVEKYGADSLRMGILVGGNVAARTTPLDEDKVRGYRNFGNKMWNMGRFLQFKKEQANKKSSPNKDQEQQDLDVINKLTTLKKYVTSKIDSYDFKLAGEALYTFMWDTLASNYLEAIKDRDDKKALDTFNKAFRESLIMLHPFMPFVTEAIWQEIKEENDPPLIISSWPTVK